MAFLKPESPENFEFFLADRMGRTIMELRASMTPGEYLAWNRYHAVRAIERQRHEGSGGA